MDGSHMLGGAAQSRTTTTTTHYEIKDGAIFSNGHRLPSKNFAGTIESVDIKSATVIAQQGAKGTETIQMRSIVYLDIKGTRDWLTKGFYSWPPPLAWRTNFSDTVLGSSIQGVIFQDKPNKSKTWLCYSASINLSPKGEAALEKARVDAEEQATARQREIGAQKAQKEAKQREMVTAWRANGSKVELPEEAQRHKVLAEEAFKEKNLQKAIKEYNAALEIYPTWPSGHFNLALILGELQNFSQAAEHMSMYLELDPNAADA
jgi:tetratricopeptide (TPR) repeat protein